MTAVDRLRQLAPHWAVMFLLMIGLLSAARQAIGDLGFVASMALIVAVALAYPAVVRRLGVAPEPWR